MEENLRTKVLIQDDFTEVDPLEGMNRWKRFIKKILPDAIHPQADLMTYW